MSDKTIDCRQLAATLKAQRAEMPVERIKGLAERFGIDATRSLTDIEGIDYGNAEAWGDVPDMHALRYVPLSHFTPADIDLMLVHHESIGLMMPMARQTLEINPLVAAQNFEGDLLLTLCACLAAEAFPEPVQVPTPFPAAAPRSAGWALDLVDAAERTMWAAFARAADGRREGEFVKARKLISWGPPMAETPWFSRFDDIMNTIAEARAWLQPPRVHARAVSEALYIVPKNAHLQIVPPETFEREAQSAEHAFQRLTVFEILTPRDTIVPGVDLVSRAVSSIEDWRGTRVPTVDRGIDLAMDLFGIPPALWDECQSETTGPANHFALSEQA